MLRVVHPTFDNTFVAVRYSKMHRILHFLADFQIRNILVLSKFEWHEIFAFTYVYKG